MADAPGIARLRKRLAAIPASVKDAVQPALRKQAEAMAVDMRALVPVDEGDLRASIVVTPGGKSTPPFSQPGGRLIVPELAVVVTAGNEDVRYAHLVEFGTVKAPAQAFFWPSVRLNRKRTQRNIKAAVGRAVRKGWGK